jgi:hypothetical protein
MPDLSSERVLPAVGGLDVVVRVQQHRRARAGVGGEDARRLPGDVDVARAREEALDERGCLVERRSRVALESDRGDAHEALEVIADAVAVDAPHLSFVALAEP